MTITFKITNNNFVIFRKIIIKLNIVYMIAPLNFNIVLLSFLFYRMCDGFVMSYMQWDPGWWGEIHIQKTHGSVQTRWIPAVANLCRREAWVVLIAVRITARKDCLRVFMEGGNLTVMRALQHDGPPPWEARVFVDEIRSGDLREGLQALNFGRVRRSSNDVAHRIARWMSTRTHVDNVELHDIPMDMLTW